MKVDKGDWLKIPNLLSYFRVLLIPIFSYIYLTATTIEDYMIAAGILFVSGLTDALDGYIARNFNQGTQLGKLIDPVADKLTQLAVATMLFIKWPIVLYLLLLFIIKEFSIFLISYLLFKKRKIIDGAKWFGKIGTIVFYGCMFILVIMPEMAERNVIVLILLTSIFQIVAFVGYMNLFFNMYKEVQ
ncbi:CDP-alcohol phosphatidyltransferase family protein [Marinilactibacillus sp. GCM10026970]|uniref:CDP-alcohol phosphatidyltransferase family protein n=1 Tax=Marinilactibacillus sp. GCM10026970 TaxID=3252642 RepID=UPI003605E922